MVRRDALVAIDEGSRFFPAGQAPRCLFEVLTGGRERGHNLIFVTQMLRGSGGGGGIDVGIRRQMSHLISFRMT